MGDPPRPRRADGERACQRCASLRHASRPLTQAGWSAGPICAAVVVLGASRWVFPQEAQPSRASAVWGWGMCLVGECPDWVSCSFLSAEGGVEPVASDSEVVCSLFWCRSRPRFLRWGCCSGGRQPWFWELEVMVVEVGGEKDVAGRHVQAAPPVAQGRAAGGQGCAARGHGYGRRLMRCVRQVVPSQVVPESVGEWPEEAGVAGGGVRSWTCELRAVAGVEVPGAGAVGEAVCGS